MANFIWALDFWPGIGGRCKTDDAAGYHGAINALRYFVLPDMPEREFNEFNGLEYIYRQHRNSARCFPARDEVTQASGLLGVAEPQPSV